MADCLGQNTALKVLNTNLESFHELICKDSPLMTGPKFFDVLKEKVNTSCKGENILMFYHYSLDSIF